MYAVTFHSIVSLLSLRWAVEGLPLTPSLHHACFWLSEEVALSVNYFSLVKRRNVTFS